GRGSREPVADNANVTGRAQNRRVEIFLAEQAA
ncbi:MAG TPA: OmpA family protein, partial [Burkholderiaceae bacterium]|nr:OmpA family protein [Burkholderiaceae bacterium]